MNIAELFINLGVKGTDKTLGGIQSVQKGLKDTASTSLEAKAALVGAMYALERLFSASGKVGTDLTNFNATVGTSAKTLQQYQYAARQVGVSNEEVTGTFRSLQKSMTDTLLNGQAPKGMARLAQVLGDVKKEDIEEWSRKPELLFQKLQEYANKERSLPLRNEVLRSFGLGDNMIAGMARNGFRPDVMQRAPTYSDKEVASLDRANVAWSNLGNKIEMAFGHLNAAHGGQLVNDISKITDKVILLSEAFLKLAEKAELFKWLGKTFEGWQLIFEGLTKAVDFLNATKVPGSDEKDKRSEKEKAEDETYVPPHLEGSNANVIKAWHNDEKRRLASKAGWESFTDFVTDQYGKHVLGVAQPDDKHEKTDADHVRSNPHYRPPELRGKSEADAESWRQGVLRRERLTLGVVNALDGLTSPRLKLAPPPANVPPILHPRQAAAAGAAGGPAVVNFEQNINFSHTGAVDPRTAAAATRNGVREAYRELSAQGEGG